MKQLIALVTLICCAGITWAKTNDCPPLSKKRLPKNTVIFFYQVKKNNALFYVPILMMANEKFSNARDLQLPPELKLFNVHDNKSVRVHFKNIHDNADYSLCRPIGEEKVSTANEN